MYPAFNVQRASVSGLLSANLGGTNSAFHVPTGTGATSPPIASVAVEPNTPFMTNGIHQHANLLASLHAADGVHASVSSASTGPGSTSTSGTLTKTVGTVLPLVSQSPQRHSPIEQARKSSAAANISSANHHDGSSTSFCSICSDRATGKHYGANSCDGCKGFFRRTVRKNQTYVCRFSRNCVIDKDKRNTCRHCRFRKCILAGMRKEAVQNERDRISCKRPKSETPPESNGSATTGGGNSKYSPMDTISFLLHAESLATQIRASVITPTAVGASQPLPPPPPPPPPPEATINPKQPRLATVSDLSEAIKQQLLLLVEWAKVIPPFSGLPLDDQVALLRSYASQHLLLGVARRSLPYKDVLLLGNDACIPRSHSSEIHDVNHVVLRLLDELVEPMREIQLDDTEYACVKALLFFNPNAYGLNMKGKVKETRQLVLEALQTYTNQKPTSEDIVRFGNILLLLPPLQAMSQQFIEDLQLATLFGMARFDKLLEELLLAAAEPLSAPFLVDGISAVANKMAGNLMGLVGGNGHASSNGDQNQLHSEDNGTALGTVKTDDDQDSMIVDVVGCTDPTPANGTY